MTAMPATFNKPDPSSGPPELGRIIEKIKRSGSDSLNQGERMLVVEIFRRAAITGQKPYLEAKDAIQKAHLFFCWRLTK